MNPIISFDGSYRWLSNFWLCPVYYENQFYPSAEHAFQAAKYPQQERHLFLNGLTSSQAKRLGRKRKFTKQEKANWESRKVQVMKDIVFDKFERNESLQQRLLKTGYCELIEGNNHGDDFWGMIYMDDGTLYGENHLGNILMEVRDYIRNVV